jgi:N-acetylmuramoyl-L-alanine amidase
VAPARKEDPGELFPWACLAGAGIGLWPGEQQGSLPPAALMQFGYDPDAPMDKVITAFQRHFRPAGITGEWDEDCGLRLASLLAKPAASGL